MSQLLINQYFNRLSRLRQMSGGDRETQVRAAFQRLLEDWGETKKLTFVAEYDFLGPARNTCRVDGVLLQSLRAPFGWWEAKDSKDDLQEEITKKLRRGYPQDNILFEDGRQAVLIQNRRQLEPVSVTDPAALERLLKQFFDYEPETSRRFRKAVNQFKSDLPAVLTELRGRIETAYADNKPFVQAARDFLVRAKETINPVIADADIREMLIQHILTEDIFARVFNDSEFHRENNVAKALYRLESLFFRGEIRKATLAALEPYYSEINATAAQIGNHGEKQRFLKAIYEDFYKVYNPKAADRLGVVYTPTEIVRFMIESADWLCERHFGRNLIDRDVEILDPATGTGTFIVELLEHFRGQPEKLKYKYREELHANEVAILPYYVANLNIEATYAAITERYEEFPNLCFVDTLDNVAALKLGAVSGELFGAVSDENIGRIKRQNARKISVVIGNPPYNANQQNENENNKNRAYPAIDKRIKATYIRASTAQKTKLYDMYARFVRWASDRIAEDGVIAFVSNSSFIDSRTFDGFRKVLAAEFNEIRVIDLKGNARTSGERRRREGGNIFEDQIRVGVAVWFCVKRKGQSGCRIFYEAARDYAKANEKRAFLMTSPLSKRTWSEIKPDIHHNWIELAGNDWSKLLPLASNKTKVTKVMSLERAVFKTFSNGVNTARDEWVTDLNSEKLMHKVRSFLSVYKQHRADTKKYDKTIKWSRNLKSKLAKAHTSALSPSDFLPYAYRPYTRTNAFLSDLLIDEKGALRLFGASGERTINLPATGPFRCLASNVPTDFHFIGDTRVFAQNRLSKDGGVIDNITDWALEQFTTHYGPKIPITKDDSSTTSMPSCTTLSIARRMR